MNTRDRGEQSERELGSQETTRFLSVHRKFTVDERMRFERVKRITAKNQTKLMADAEDKWAAMEAAFAAMQVLKAERE